jgi:hypothetical protein
MLDHPGADVLDRSVDQGFDKYGIIASFDAGLAKAVRHTDPFLMYDFTPWSGHVYDLILKYLPDESAYFPLTHNEAKRADGTYARLRWPLQRSRIAILPPEARDFWGEMYTVLMSNELRDVFKKWLEPALVARFKCPLSEIPAFPAPQLLRDSHGYKISPHADTDIKVITTQWYLPRTNSQAHLGTKVHNRLKNGQFEEVRAMQFVPNRGYAFAVTNDSWHSVASMTEEDGIRDSLMMFYYVEDMSRP